MNEEIRQKRETIRQHVAGFFVATIQNIIQNIGPSFKVTIICRDIQAQPGEQRHFIFGNDHDDDKVLEAYRAMRNHENHYFDSDGQKMVKN